MTYMAVLTDFRVDNRVSAVGVNCQVRAVGFAVFAEQTACAANLCLCFAVVLGGTSYHLLSLVRNDGNQILRASVCTILAAYAFVRVNISNTVNDRYGLVAANCRTSALPKAACCAKSQSLEILLRGFLAGLDSHFLEFRGSSAVTCAFYESNI